MQSRRQSIIEVVTNTAVGMLGSFLISLAVLTDNAGRCRPAVWMAVPIPEDCPPPEGNDTLGMTTLREAILTLLKKHKGRYTIEQVCDMLPGEVARSTVTVNLRRLRKAGLLETDTAPSGHGRPTLFYMYPKGK